MPTFLLADLSICKKTMKTSLFSLLFGIALLALSCDKTKDGQFSLGEHFELAYGATATCTCDSLSVKFQKVVEDSRCPSDVECVWAGRIVIELEVVIDGVAQTVTLSSENNEEPATVGNYVITMGAVTPYPVSTVVIQPGEYKVDLLIEEL